MSRIPAHWAIILSSLLFALMAVCAKFAAPQYTAGEMVFYRGLVGVVVLLGYARWHRLRLATRVPAMHFWRSLSGVISLGLWFYAIGNLPLATATTLNYMSSVWMGLFLIGGATVMGSARIDGRLVATVLIGFIGVGLVLRPTIERDQLWHGLMGLLSGMGAAIAYLQVTALGRAGEPEARVVFYFSVAGVAGGMLSMLWTGASPHSWSGVALLLSIGLLATLAQLLMTRAYATGATLVNASLHYLGIAFSYVFGVVLFGETITWMAMAGILLIVGAGLAASRLRSAAPPGAQGKTPSES